MDKLDPTSSIHADRKTRELYFTIAGFWTPEAMEDFLRDLSKAAVPFMKEREAFTAMGNLAEFVPQDRATADAIRDSLLLGTKNGLKRFAVVSPSPLVKMQYRRIGAGLEVEFSMKNTPRCAGYASKTRLFGRTNRTKTVSRQLVGAVPPSFNLSMVSR